MNVVRNFTLYANMAVTDGFSEYYFLKELFLQYGFPPLKDSDYPSCGVIGLNKGCSQDRKSSQYLISMFHS